MSPALRRERIQREPPSCGRSRTCAATLDDIDTVGRIHDRLVLLIPTHTVVLMTRRSQHLDHLAATSRPAVDAACLQPVTNLRLNPARLGNHRYLQSGSLIKPYAGDIDIGLQYRLVAWTSTDPRDIALGVGLTVGGVDSSSAGPRAASTASAATALGIVARQASPIVGTPLRLRRTTEVVRLPARTGSRHRNRLTSVKVAGGGAGVEAVPANTRTGESSPSRRQSKSTPRSDRRDYRL
jgi:hypothetical protein